MLNEGSRPRISKSDIQRAVIDGAALTILSTAIETTAVENGQHATIILDIIKYSGLAAGVLGAGVLIADRLLHGIIVRK